MDMTMKHYFPKYCEKFRCIANLCPDSCCRDWDVVVDDTSFDFYNTAKGEFGDRLRSLMTIDEDGDRIFIMANDITNAGAPKGGDLPPITTPYPAWPEKPEFLFT